MDETRKPARKPGAKAAAKPAARTLAPSKATPARKVARAAPAVQVATTPSLADREQRVRMAAYFRAERRGFAAGYEWEDWLAAEAEAGPAPAPEPKPRRTSPAKKSRA